MVQKSCTSWYVVYSIIYKVYISQGGAGFLPSTVCFYSSTLVHQNLKHPPWRFDFLHCAWGISTLGRQHCSSKRRRPWSKAWQKETTGETTPLVCDTLRLFSGLSWNLEQKKHFSISNPGLRGWGQRTVSLWWESSLRNGDDNHPNWFPDNRDSSPRLLDHQNNQGASFFSYVVSLNILYIYIDRYP